MAKQKKAETEYEPAPAPTGFVIALGDAFDGVTLFGDPQRDGALWSDATGAAEYAERHFSGSDWHVVDVFDPKP